MTHKPYIPLRNDISHIARAIEIMTTIM